VIIMTIIIGICLSLEVQGQTYAVILGHSIMICNFQCFTKELSDNPHVLDNAAFSFHNCNVEAFLERVVLP
jgi:hypothetical protein